MANADNRSFWPKWEENKPFALALLILLAFLITFLNFKIEQTIKATGQIGEAEPVEHQITVEGQAAVFGKPDLATLFLGVQTQADDVAAAQGQNTATVDILINEIKELGITPDDIQTSSYNIYEDVTYDPDTGERESAGWVVFQQLTVKVRDLGLLSSVIETAGENSVTEISGPNFSIEDEEKLKDEARPRAIAVAQEKAVDLSAALGVNLERVVSYNEWTGGDFYPSYLGYGGEGESISTLSSKSVIEPGTQELILSVSITYQLKD